MTRLESLVIAAAVVVALAGVCGALPSNVSSKLNVPAVNNDHLVVVPVDSKVPLVPPPENHKEVEQHHESVSSKSMNSDLPSFPYAQGFAPRSLLIAVMTAPHHFSARAAIRDHFRVLRASQLIPAIDQAGIDVKFFIGQLDTTNPNMTSTAERLQDEFSRYSGEMVHLEGFVESYFNLTRKTIHIVEWAVQNGYKSIFKMDDDTFLRLENLVQFLKAEPHPQYIYAGSFVSDTPVNDNPNSKWYNFDLYPHDIYPEYASGPGYYLGERVVEYLYQARNSLIVYRVEDAGVGIWLHEVPNPSFVDRVNLQTITYTTQCEDSVEIIYVNPANAVEMRQLAKNVMRNGDMCGDSSSRFSMHECVERPCLCHPLPEACETGEMISGVNGADGSKTWSEFSNEGYQDLIPRLVQVDKATKTAKVITARKPANARA